MFSVIFESDFLLGFKRFWVNINNKTALSALLREAIEYKGPFQLERVSFVRSIGVDLRAPTSASRPITNTWLRIKY